MKGAWSDKKGWEYPKHIIRDLYSDKPTRDSWSAVVLAYVLGLLSMGGAVLVCQHFGYWP